MKINVGVFDLFSHFIAGLPIILAAILILQFSSFDIQATNTLITNNSSIPIMILSIIITYTVGSLISGITWPIFKFFHNIFGFFIKRKIGSTDSNLLKELNWTVYEITNDALNKLRAKNIPNSILKYIKRMKNRRFETENEFLDELRASFKDDELTRQYETIFLQCALKHAEVPIYLEKETFLNAPFEKRLAFLVKQRIGVSKIQWIAQRISPYLRQKGIENAALAENHIAMHIMFRNLWFGFLIISIILAIGAFQNANRLGSYIIFSSTFFIASIISFKRALLFYSWHSREILFGFYHLAIDNQISNQPTSNNDNLPDHLSRV